MISPKAFGQLKDANGNLIAPVAFANVDAITTTMVPAPNLGSSAEAGGGDSPQWLKVEFHYGTTPALKTRFLDSVEFKVVIEGRDPDAPNPTQSSGKGVAIGLTGSVTYINIAPGKDLYGSFYVHPSTLARYSDKSADQFTREFDIHLEAWVNGVMQDAIDKNKEKDANWFKALVTVPNLVYRQDQSPFIAADPGRYPAIKMSAPAQ